MIHCQKCKHENAPDAQKCSQCNADLLPGMGMRERLIIFGGTILVSVICIALTKFLLHPDIGLWIAVGLGVVVLIGFGLVALFYKSPLYERYEMRGKRHVKLDPRQAIADYGKAIELAPEIKVFEFLGERAKLFQKQGMAEEARSDWQHALENVSHRITAGKDTDLELHKQRAETYKHLGMQDEYAMEMLGYTIIKEKTLKFEKREIVRDIDSGMKKGVEDVKRNELQKLRRQVMNKRRYGIVGRCAQCGAIVELDDKLDCTNNPKHYRIRDISPIIKTSDKT